MDDVISRKAAIRWVKTQCNPYGKPTLEYESGKKVIEHLEQMPSAHPEDWMERNKERILQAGMKGQEIEFRIGGRLFAIREKAQ